MTQSSPSKCLFILPILLLLTWGTPLSPHFFFVTYVVYPPLSTTLPWNFTLTTKVSFTWFDMYFYLLDNLLIFLCMHVTKYWSIILATHVLNSLYAYIITNYHICTCYIYIYVCYVRDICLYIYTCYVWDHATCYVWDQVKLYVFSL